MIGVEGAKHLWVGEPAVRRVLDEVVAHVLPGHGPLPTTWDGPMTTAAQPAAASEEGAAGRGAGEGGPMTTDGMLALHRLRAGRPGSTPLVLLHGFPLDHRMWLDVTDLLPGDPTVLAVDLPGFGVSRSARTWPRPSAAGGRRSR